MCSSLGIQNFLRDPKSNWFETIQKGPDRTNDPEKSTTALAPQGRQCAVVESRNLQYATPRALNMRLKLRDVDLKGIRQRNMLKDEKDWKECYAAGND
jgi:hypothetical protein